MNQSEFFRKLWVAFIIWFQLSFKRGNMSPNANVYDIFRARQAMCDNKWHIVLWYDGASIDDIDFAVFTKDGVDTGWSNAIQRGDAAIRIIPEAIRDNLIAIVNMMAEIPSRQRQQFEEYRLEQIAKRNGVTAPKTKANNNYYSPSRNDNRSQDGVTLPRSPFQRPPAIQWDDDAEGLDDDPTEEDVTPYTPKPFIFERNARSSDDGGWDVADEDDDTEEDIFSRLDARQQTEWQDDAEDNFVWKPTPFNPNHYRSPFTSRDWHIADDDDTEDGG